MAETPRLVRAMRGEALDRRPLWIMRQAGRYLPEYRELRRNRSFRELSRSPELAARVTLLPMARYPFDAAIVFADIMSPLPALGVEFDFDPGPVVARPVRDRDGVDALRVPDPEQLAPRGDGGAPDGAGRTAARSCGPRVLRRAVDPRRLSGRGARSEGFSPASGRSPARRRRCCSGCSDGWRMRWRRT